MLIVELSAGGDDYCADVKLTPLFNSTLIYFPFKFRFINEMNFKDFMEVSMKTFHHRKPFSIAKIEFKTENIFWIYLKTTQEMYRQRYEQQI